MRTDMNGDNGKSFDEYQAEGAERQARARAGSFYARAAAKILPNVLDALEELRKANVGEIDENTLEVRAGQAALLARALERDEHDARERFTLPLLPELAAPSSAYEHAEQLLEELNGVAIDAGDDALSVEDERTLLLAAKTGRRQEAEKHTR